MQREFGGSFAAPQLQQRLPRGGPFPSCPSWSMTLSCGRAGLGNGMRHPRCALCWLQGTRGRADVVLGSTDLSSLLPFSCLSLVLSPLSWLLSACAWLLSAPSLLLLGDGGRVGRGMDQPLSWPCPPRVAPTALPLLPPCSLSPPLQCPNVTPLPLGAARPLPGTTGASLRTPGHHCPVPTPLGDALRKDPNGTCPLCPLCPWSTAHAPVFSCSCGAMWEAALL